MPGGYCPSGVLAPGTVFGSQLQLAFRAASRWTLLAGGGYTWAANRRAGPGSDRITTPTLHGGIRLIPLSSDGQGMAVEMRVTRCTRSLGSLRWTLTPTVSWRF